MVTIGVLALQGGFAEHIQMLSQLRSVAPITVKTPEDLALCAALIIPGGESTTMALLARLNGLLEPLREFVRTKPVWGTCAGAILLSKEVIGTKKGGQEVLAGMDVKIGRNGWGSQTESFEAELDVLGMKERERPFRGVFIRAPVVLELLGSSEEGTDPIRVIARLPADVHPSAETSPFAESEDQIGDVQRIVALRQGQHMLTTFHPELTQDSRFHDMFIRECVLGDTS